MAATKTETAKFPVFSDNALFMTLGRITRPNRRHPLPCHVLGEDSELTQ